MLKKLLVGSVLLSTSLVSQAGIIDTMNGAQLQGISVTALFGDGASEQFSWVATNLDSGGVIGTGWSLSLSGSTFGEIDNTDPLNPVTFGGWELVNDTVGAGIVGLSIDAGIAGVYFDTLDDAEYTAGSNVGRFFAEETGNATATYADSFSNIDLFGTLNIEWSQAIGVNSETVFLTDTDIATVSEPATALVFLSGLLALVNFRRKS
jgi:hypothetical protein